MPRWRAMRKAAAWTSDRGFCSRQTPRAERRPSQYAMHFLSSFDAMLSEPDALGGRVLADQVVGPLTTNRDVYGDAVKP
jgi:hypothetical protein